MSDSIFFQVENNSLKVFFISLRLRIKFEQVKLLAEFCHLVPIETFLWLYIT